MTPATITEDEQLARDFEAWSDVELRDHYEASQTEALVQFRLGDRKTAMLSHLCRISADRYAREMVRRAKERCAK
jgi:hypothetical protein